MPEKVWIYIHKRSKKKKLSSRSKTLSVASMFNNVR